MYLKLRTYFIPIHFSFLVFLTRCKDADKSSAKQIKIKTVGERVPDALSTFNTMQKTYSLSPKLMENLNKSGYTVPTPIQTQAIPVMLQASPYVMSQLFMY